MRLFLHYDSTIFFLQLSKINALAGNLFWLVSQEKARYTREEERGFVMRCQILPENCIACGLCQLYAPAVFDYDDAGIVLFVNQPNAQQQWILPKDQEAVRKACQRCPVRAIEIEKA